jgi:hypothetical protein
MDDNNLKAFEHIMASLNELFGDPAKKVSHLKMDLYYNALKDLSIEQLNNAVNVLCQTKMIKTWPLPAEIRQAVEGSLQDKAAVAFDKLLGAVRSVGPYQTVIFDDPAIHTYVQSYGGWEEICDKTTEEWKYMRNEFIKGYNGYTSRTDVPLQLTGIHDAMNRAKGYDHYIPPSIIGDSVKALEWTNKLVITRGNSKLKAIKGGVK